MSTARCMFTDIRQMLSLKHQLFAKFGRINNISVSVSYVSKSTIARCVYADEEKKCYRRPKEKLTIIAKINTPNNNINPS